MTDPVTDNEGNSYERSAIEEWLGRHRTSPITRAPLEIADLRPNRALKSLIEAELARGTDLNGVRGPPLDEAKWAQDKAEAEMEDIEWGLQLEVHSTLPGPTKEEVLAESKDGEGKEGESKDGEGKVDGEEEVNEVYALVRAVSVDSKHRLPMDVVLCVDCSGSMGCEASVPGVESNSLTIMDIVTHAVRTIIEVLGPQDRLSIVSYSNTAEVRSCFTLGFKIIYTLSLHFLLCVTRHSHWSWSFPLTTLSAYLDIRHEMTFTQVLIL